MTGISVGLPEDAREPYAVADTRGVLHDVGHQLMTLSLLAETVLHDASLTGESRRRLEIVRQEIFRAMDMITEHVAAQSPDLTASSPGPIDTRDLAAQAAQLAQLAYGPAVRVLPGPPAVITISPTSLWRVLSNLIDNAARSAGSGGRVVISIRQEADTVVDVVDDGPGFGCGPGGMAGLGLSVVRELLYDNDSRLEIASRPGVGTRARVTLCQQRDRAMVSAGTGTWH